MILRDLAVCCLAQEFAFLNDTSTARFSLLGDLIPFPCLAFEASVTRYIYIPVQQSLFIPLFKRLGLGFHWHQNRLVTTETTFALIKRPKEEDRGLRAVEKRRAISKCRKRGLKNLSLQRGLPRLNLYSRRQHRHQHSRPFLSPVQ